MLEIIFGIGIFVITFINLHEKNILMKIEKWLFLITLLLIHSLL